jgi:hypothetical protein
MREPNKHRPEHRCEADPNASKPKCLHGVPYTEPCAVCDAIIAGVFHRQDGGRMPPERLVDDVYDDFLAEFED